jgi:hypothetical protein
MISDARLEMSGRYFEGITNAAELSDQIDKTDGYDVKPWRRSVAGGLGIRGDDIFHEKFLLRCDLLRGFGLHKPSSGPIDARRFGAQDWRLSVRAK